VRGRQAWVVVLLVMLAGCGASATTVPPGASTSSVSGAGTLPMLPRDALTGYVVRSQALDANSIAVDTADPSAVQAILSTTGFQTGVERRFTAHWRPLTEVSARVLRFGDPSGAKAYLTWLRANSGELLGPDAQISAPPKLPGAVAFVHRPCDGCTKDPLQYVSAWTRGPYALILLLGGAHAGRAAATPLARELDARVRTEG
jgi:hypothetical protein